jgi:hypothetical protein
MLRRGRRNILYHIFPPIPNVRSYEAPRLRRQCQKCDSIDTLPSHYAQSTWPDVGGAYEHAPAGPFQCTKRLSINSFERFGREKQGSLSCIDVGACCGRFLVGGRMSAATCMRLRLGSAAAGY